jgi:hypothetical protein
MIFQTIIVPAVAAALAEASSPAFKMNVHKGNFLSFFLRGREFCFEDAKTKQNELK